MNNGVKVIKRDEKPQRIRPQVIRKLLLDEKAALGRRIKEIDVQLSKRKG